MGEPVLDVEHLSIDYVVGAGRFHALTDVSLRVEPGRVVGIVGETGCGKSTLARAIPRLLPQPPAEVTGGRIRFLGTDLLSYPAWKLPFVRGTGIGMIFQEPLNSLNPAYRVYDQVAEAIRIRRGRDASPKDAPRSRVEPFDYSRGPPPVATSSALAHPLAVGGLAARSAERAKSARSATWDEALDFLRLVRINDPETILGLYPHELSGGMRQRIMIAMALSGRPALLIADEPTSALDVTIQAQVLTLMKELIEEVRTSILFITHDLGVVAEMADELGVMYAGHLVEYGPVEEVFHHPRHPYTAALLKSSPRRYKADGPLDSIPGAVPNLSRLPTGCSFHPRCVLARPECASDPGPSLVPVGTTAGDPATHLSACLFASDVEAPP